MQTGESMQRVSLWWRGCLTHTLYDLAGVEMFFKLRGPRAFEMLQAPRYLNPALSASRNHLTIFADLSSPTHVLRLCSAIVHFIRNSYLCFVCHGWAAQVLTALATLPISVACLSCCTSSKTAVAEIETFDNVSTGKKGNKKFSGLL